MRYLIREIFTAKPGMAGKLAKLFKKGFADTSNMRIITDMTGPYNTVIVEMEIDSLAEWERNMENMRTGKPDPNMNPEAMEEMSKYTDMYLTGRREIFKIESEANSDETLGKIYAKELESEARATRKCLERIPFQELSQWKPHEKSMKLGDLAVVCSDIPKWIALILTKGEIDFATWERVQIKTTEDLVKHFDRSMEEAKKVLEQVSDEEFKKTFSLKNRGQILSSSSKRDSVSSSINHLVHHRGQLTVYMRLNNLPVPSIYGPSADEMKWD